jgi:hypothetical protein
MGRRCDLSSCLGWDHRVTEGYRYCVKDSNNCARLWSVPFKERLNREASIYIAFMWRIVYSSIDNAIANLLEHVAACTISTLEARF